MKEFRAWDGHKMIYPDYRPGRRDEHSWAISATGKYLKLFDDSYPDCEPLYIIMQYTGLHDKNGKEIFEGDIVFHDTESKSYDAKGLWREGTAYVKYGNFGFYFNEIDCGDWRFRGPEGAEWEKDKLEIIGNIYENPELVKDSE